MNAFSRRGFCPALSAPMATGDGLLVRLNPVGFEPAKLAALCQAAERHGNGVLEVTGRGNLQIRGLTGDSAPLLAAEVDALGIRVHSGVPVETSALAGLDPEEIADPRPLAEALRVAIEVAGLAARLGPKVSIVVDGGGRSGLDALSADVRVKAIRDGDAVAWELGVAGDERTQVAFGQVTEAEAAGKVLEILEGIAASGLAARARDLLRESDLGRQRPTSPGSRLDTTPTNLGVFNLIDSRVAVIIALPFGQTDTGRLIALVEQTACSASGIRLAQQRRLVLICPSVAAADSAEVAARRLGFITDASDPRRSMDACTGAPACASGHIAAREIGERIATGHPNLFDGSLTLHVSGCAKGCAHPGMANLTLVGGENGAGLVADGTARDRPVAYVAAGETAEAFGRVAVLVERERRPGETTAVCMGRIGTERVAAAFKAKA
jgi:precorrin-3B synthase